ncbi:MAG: hypothetical protein EYX74_03910 [Desulfobulbaceae bacterium]|nr:MAG: hypothetical protein EYX74_03910 [Desulfobulbaceae bacterium]
MKAQIMLDIDEVQPQDLPAVEQQFRKWYADNHDIDINYDRHRFDHRLTMDNLHRFPVDFGLADPTHSLQQLHAALFPYEVKLFVHFLH